MKIFLLFFFSFLTLAQSELTLRSLSDYSTYTLSSNSNEPHIFILFQKNCSACHRQLKDLQCLEQKTPLLLIGAFSNEKTMRQEYKKLKSSWPGFFGGKDFLNRFQITQKASPQIIISYKNKSKRLLGLTDCKVLLKTYKEITRL